MNDAHGITKENLLFTFPAALRENESIAALGDVTAEALAARPEEIRRLSIYPRIQELPEDLLDILAYDFKVDWWDQDAPVEQKRRTLEDNWNVHRRLGTRWAVLTELNNVHPGATVQEWFEYGGSPYCFRVTIPIIAPGMTLEKETRALNRIWYYKNLRSHLERIDYIIETTPAFLRMGGFGGIVMQVEVPEIGDRFDFRDKLRMGGTGTIGAEIPVPQRADEFDFRNTTRVGGAGAIGGSILVPERADVFDFQDAARVGGTGSVGTNMPVPERADVFDFKNAARVGGGGSVGAMVPVPQQADTFDFQNSVQLGGAGAIGSEMPVPERGDDFQFRDSIRAGGGAGTTSASIPVPEKADAPEIRGEARTGGRNTGITATLPVPEIKKEE